MPYKSGGALLPDVIGGAIEGAMTEFSTALALHKGGKARIVAIAAKQRSKLAPDIPTFIEGGVKDFTAQSYIGILAPAKTPPDIDRQAAEGDRGRACQRPGAAEKLRAMGSEIATPEQMTLGRLRRLHQAADYEDMQRGGPARRHQASMSR